ncbi:MAG: biopolymer transporter ExbD [Lentisphaerae bacterium]|nr:biopolymer transporter ExbD [Lentisphaerota bacterium]
MTHKPPLTALRPISEINLTPLMDLTFILLITFIITFPLIEQGISVNLPKGNADPITTDASVTITIDAAGKVFLDNVPLDLSGLKESIMQTARTQGNLTVMVRADELVRYGKVVDVLKILHEAEISKMALVTQAEESAGK